jgi:thiamine pyrophosphate-dependent acetolactate synthase large subunit-like protein
MAIFNAWCDRMPILILGATGPVDAMKRRPWIDWIHTAADQGAIIRNFTKWDDQPASAGAAREAVLRAYWLSNTAPCGPTYINLDAEVQESKLPAPLPALDAKRYMPLVVQGPSAELAKKAAELLLNAKKPLILAGRMSRKEDDWKRRIALAEALDARVATNLKIGAAFPTDHPLHVGYRGEGRRCDPQPRLGRSRRHLQGNRRHAVIDRDPGLARPEPAQRLEHGLRRPAGGGPVHSGRG